MIDRIKYRLALIREKFVLCKYLFRKSSKRNVLSADLNYNSDGERMLEISSDLKIEEKVIITCYFIKKKDPLKGIVRNKPDIKYIILWYTSLKKLGRQGIVVHDGLDDEFIQEYETEKIKFIKFNAGNYSIFEERWIAYFLLLKVSNLKFAFFTDANDVIITRDPFEAHSDKEKLYVGRDQANRIKDSGWMLEELEQFENDSSYKAPQSFKYQSVYNAGVVGGTKSTLILLIEQIIHFTFLTKTDNHKDMTLINLSIHYLFKPKLSWQLSQDKFVDPSNDFGMVNKNIVTGYPLNSKFQAFESNSKATFIHK